MDKAVISYLEGTNTLPLYAYRCTQCGHKFEKIQNFSAEPESECPKCHGVLERPLTAPGLSFKGAGWYVNDYASKSSSSSSDSDSDSRKETSASETKSDSKSESKSSESKSNESSSSAPASTPSSTSSTTTSSTPNSTS
ncbi:MAG: FmdB family zinc ribbon protein [Terracidiphilus sp.]|jgi:putative FmdB family regulatory protein